ncbi:hypothetical protein ES703_64696 [subsurface metagenome]
MTDKKETVLKTLEDIQNLRNFLKAEMTVGNPEDGNVKIEIKVSNDAPESTEGSEVVFLGVGLTIVDGREQAHTNWTSKVRLLSKPEQNSQARQKYNRGDFVIGGNGVRFPAVTSDENSHGQTLFPGESLVFEIGTTENQPPYLDISIEGSVSRRHLLHISRPMDALKKWSQPLVVQTFQNLNKIDLYSSLVIIVDAIPTFSPQTTLADIDTFKGDLDRAIEHVKVTMPKLNEVYHAAPNQSLRNMMKQHVGAYLETSARICQAVLKTLSGGDLEKMAESSKELKAHLLTIGEVEKVTADSKVQFDIAAD